MLFLLPFLLIPFLFFVFILNRLGMSPSLSSIASSIFDRLGGIYYYISDSEAEHGKQFAVLRHCRPFVVYQGVKTTVPISVLGNRPLPRDRQIFLQQRGYRTGLFGWDIGTYMGGGHLPGVDVTPASSGTLTNKDTKSFADDIKRLAPKSGPVQETLVLHIPVASGDGYFRLRVTDGRGRLLAASPAFRVGSISWRSSVVRGATPFGLIPELTVRTAGIAVETAAWAAFYVAFPILKIAQYTPGPWRAWALRTLDSRYQLNIAERIKSAQSSLQGAKARAGEAVPFGAVGVRTQADMKRDAENGRGGMWVRGVASGTT